MNWTNQRPYSSNFCGPDSKSKKSNPSQKIQEIQLQIPAVKKEGGFSGKSDEHVDAEGVLRLPSLKMKDFDFLDDEG